MIGELVSCLVGGEFDYFVVYSSGVVLLIVRVSVINILVMILGIVVFSMILCSV